MNKFQTWLLTWLLFRMYFKKYPVYLCLRMTMAAETTWSVGTALAIARRTTTLRIALTTAMMITNVLLRKECLIIWYRDKTVDHHSKQNTHYTLKYLHYSIFNNLVLSQHTEVTIIFVEAYIIITGESLYVYYVILVNDLTECISNLNFLIIFKKVYVCFLTY